MSLCSLRNFITLVTSSPTSNCGSGDVGSDSDLAEMGGGGDLDSESDDSLADMGGDRDLESDSGLAEMRGGCDLVSESDDSLAEFGGGGDLESDVGLCMPQIQRLKLQNTVRVPSEPLETLCLNTG